MRGHHINESNPAFYVTPFCVALFGETMRPAWPFRVVFNDLWSKLKIKGPRKVCGKANKLYFSVFGTSDLERLSDLLTE